jgi:hypothetical protein
MQVGAEVVGKLDRQVHSHHRVLLTMVSPFPGFRARSRVEGSDRKRALDADLLLRGCSPCSHFRGVKTAAAFGAHHEDIDLARQASQPPAMGVAGCSAPAPAPGNACTDFGAISRGAPTVFFYQVRAACDALSEGP